MDLAQVGQLSESVLVSQRDVDHAVVGKGAHGRDGSGLLTTAHGGSRDEHAGILAPEATGGPDAAGLIPEGFPLSREVTEASGDTEENGIVLEELTGLSNGVGGLGRSVHLLQDLLGESLRNPGLVRQDSLFNSWILTGRGRPFRQRLQCPSSRPRPASGCGRTWSTSINCQVRRFQAGEGRTYEDDSNLGSHGEELSDHLAVEMM